MSQSLRGQPATAELRRWIEAQLRAGCGTDDIVRAMHGSGWEPAMARAALEQALQREAQPAPAGEERSARQVPEPALADGSTLMIAGGRAIPVLMALRRPRVLLFGSLLSDAECDALVALAEPRLARSETVDNRTGGSEVNDARTSDGMFFERGETALITRIEQRIADLLRWPVEHGEGLQILRYRGGAQYLPHYDYFDPAQPGTEAVLRRGGQRVATLIMYLRAPQRGGATLFPDAGLEVAPVKGHAVFFSYDRPDESTGTLHGGAPVLEGEKWVATKWLREREFD